MLLEEELIQRSQDGDIDAFEELVARNETKVYAIAYRFMGNADDASDLAQDAFLKAFKSIKSFRKEASFSTWMAKIVSNVCRDELRKIKRRPTSYLDEEVFLEEGTVSKQIKDTNPTPEQIIEKKEMSLFLQNLLSQMNPEYRMVIILRDIQGYSYGEIAEITETSIGTVKSRINRARKALKEKIINLRKEGEW